MAVNKGNGRWEYTLTVTWNGKNNTSGLLSQSNNNGDHLYRFYLEFPSHIKRNRYITVEGKCYVFNNYIIDSSVPMQFQDLLPLFLLWSTKQLPLSLSIGLHLIHLMLMDM